MDEYKVYNILGQDYVLLKDLKKRPDSTKKTVKNDSERETKKVKKGDKTNDENFHFSPEIIEYYWQKAAKTQKRELFMNTIRPMLKKELGYDFSEIILEKKAKILCARWSYCEENKKKYDGPYLID